MANQLYTVQTGETLKSIARERLGDETRWQELAHINSLKQPYFVSPGQLMLVPSTDSLPMKVLVTGFTEALEVVQPPDKGNAAAPEVGLKLSPAELGLLAGGVVFLWWIFNK